MTPAMVAIAAALVAGGAFALPYIPLPSRSAGLSSADRAGWVNRLFALAAAADEAGEAQIAAQARSLIAALVNQQEPAKKGK